MKTAKISRQNRLIRQFIFTFSIAIILNNNLFSQGVGLGTASPTEILHIKGAADVGIRFEGTVSGGGGLSVGPQSPTVGSNSAGIGTIVWSSTTNTASSNNSYSKATEGTSQYLKASGFDFSTVPVGASIDGIEVAIERKRTNYGASVALLDAWTSQIGATTTFTKAVTAGIGRLLVLVVAHSDDDDDDYDLTAVTYGTQAMTFAAEAFTDGTGGGDNDIQRIEVWYIGEVGIAAAEALANTNFGFTASGTSPDNLGFAAATYQYVDQNTPVDDAVATATETNGTTLQIPSAMNVSTGDMAIIAATTYNNTVYTAWSGYTERVDVGTTNGSDAELGVADLSFGSVTTTQPTATLNAAENDRCVAGLVLKAATANTIYDNEVRLINAAGTIAGSNKADVSTNWPAADGSKTYGSSSDLWGLAIMEADVKDADFGVAISGITTGAVAEIDHITIRVYYTPAASLKNFTIGMDQSASSNFVISNSSALGTSNRITIDASTGIVGIGRTPTTNQLEVEGDASKTTATAWAANSDRRIKKEISDIDNSFETILKLRPVTFKYTEEYIKMHPLIKNRPYYNFIAQEYKTVFPNAVKGSGEFLPGDINEILQVDTYDAQIVTIKAVQELIKKNKEQEEIILQLKSEINNLKQTQEKTSFQNEYLKTMEAKITEMEIILKDHTIGKQITGSVK